MTKELLDEALRLYADLADKKTLLVMLEECGFSIFASVSSQSVDLQSAMTAEEAEHIKSEIIGYLRGKIDKLAEEFNNIEKGEDGGGGDFGSKGGRGQ